MSMILMGGAVRSLLWTVAAAGVLIALSSNDVEAQKPQTPDSRQALINVLPASSPHPSLGEEARVWDRFVGAWDCDYTFFLEDGSVRHSRGEVDFGWVMDGRAVQDIWITYPKEAGKERGIGTSLRFFDGKSKTWQVVFISPAYSAVITVRGGIEGDRIVLRGTDGEGAMLRWSFNDIKPDSFTWRGETSRDGGKTWKLEEEHHMRRRVAMASSKTAGQ
jgi:hypothetical protein